ncbi:glycosyltransferase family 2 protein [Shewanella submarina]|uniref:Glycosyltransferase family 2 protein n=1 Tax=Shewanella submarina TaxID=2016376 RepID=A0ABV7GKC7_9GAMM|nr:glycosyltransferase family A protein [Shewanella submarina]MCL1036539.1 glycosyltransferase family 2 protein [Shewanella submarina]
MTPRFSIIIPLYNKKGLISKTIESVLSQTYLNFEIIVVDDGSTDGSIESISGLNDERLKLFRKENGGVSSARNYGIKKAEGQYVAFLDADDEYEISFLKNINLAIEQFPDADAFCTGFFKVRGREKLRSFNPDRYAKSPFLIEDFYSLWAIDSFFCASSIVVRKEYFQYHHKWFPEGESLGEDQEVWFHLAENGSLVHIPKALSKYNMMADENSLTSQRRVVEELPFITRLKKRKEGSSYIKSIDLFIEKYDLERAFNNARVGHKKKAIKLLLDNFRGRRFTKLKLMVLLAIIMPAKRG